MVDMKDGCLKAIRSGDVHRCRVRLCCLRYTGLIFYWVLGTAHCWRFGRAGIPRATSHAPHRIKNQIYFRNGLQHSFISHQRNQLLQVFLCSIRSFPLTIHIRLPGAALHPR